ncbi:elongation factor G [Streptomyces zagrosensis]|uniref:Ribosomal protection tetracycline resistance protein n=1 Tax=Streptomyces zagrosensis TaxID=1042984 RepID=A0A7W9QGN1_9ACTN|nr:TetM/TetW/TetO/TetS family tetracycline resistance ribosomal protection protein [Streptomyces zagrosensis]MBB5939908.1 ribosomal protection tetracycline resistance protein [Streptomyces zagrosensis]
MHTLNLGILAHIDAGKTSLTERLLHAAGVIDEVGRVDDGNTHTDSLTLEKQRGITIKSAVVSFAIDGLTVNVVDTPGHPDFIAEVERVLSVLDGAVLVVSAVEGVQAQTRVLMRALRRLRIPTLIFVNKIDRRGAREESVLRELSAKLAPTVVPMGTVLDAGTCDAAVRPYDLGDVRFAATLVETLVDHDDALLAAYVHDESALSPDRLRAELAAQTGRALVHPVFFGSAITGAGVAALTVGIRELLPAARGAVDGPVAGSVFKVERGPAGEKIAYVRMSSGTLRVRDRLRFGAAYEGKVTAISVFDQGAAVRRTTVSAGQIGKVWGLSKVRIGDAIDAAAGDTGRPSAGARDAQPAPGIRNQHFAPPSLETVISPRCATDRPALHLALTQLAEQDPLINLRQDEVRQELFLSLYGEVQKEVIEATLADEYGIKVAFRATTTIHTERVLGTGSAVEVMHKEPNAFLATVGLRIEPAPVGSGVGFRLEVELGSMPYAFIKAVEDTVRQTLQQGLHGWEVADCVVTLTHSGYAARQSNAHAVFDKSMSSTAGDFRQLTPLVLMAALRQAGTRVYEPMHRFRLEAPADAVGVLLPLLARLGALPRPPAVGDASCLLEGDIPAASVHALEQRLTGLTRGEGVLESAFDSYQPVRGTVPIRERTDHHPLDRKEYLRRVMRGVAGHGPQV